MAGNNEGNVERESADLEALVKRIQSRDERGLADLYDRMSRLVYSLAYSIVQTHEDAEEVTQEVFVRVWNKIDYFDSVRGSVPAWMSTMTRRLAIDRIRSKSFKARGRESSLDVVESGGRGGSEAHIEQLAEAGEVLDALKSLDENLQNVVRLSYYEGMSHSQIAKKLEIPLGTVKSRLRDGVTRLRRSLGIGEAT